MDLKPKLELKRFAAYGDYQFSDSANVETETLEPVARVPHPASDIWRSIHLLPLSKPFNRETVTQCMSETIERLLALSQSCECVEKWSSILKEQPPPNEAKLFAVWAWERHNDVNARLNEANVGSYPFFKWKDCCKLYDYPNEWIDLVLSSTPDPAGGSALPEERGEALPPAIGD